MGIIKGINDAFGSNFADQWKDIITAGHFHEQLAVAPGLVQSTNNNRGANTKASVGVISNGSIIRIPENTAAFIFSQSGIEQVLVNPGEYIYQNGEASFFNQNGFYKSLIKQSIGRMGFGGQALVEKRVSFINLREIRGLKFSTKTPLIYHDSFYDTDLEVSASGEFSIQIINPVNFVKNYLPANVSFYSFTDDNAKGQIHSEFMQSFLQALNSLSERYRISQLPSAGKEITEALYSGQGNVGGWGERFGFKLVSVGIEDIQLSENSKELVNIFSSNKMQVDAYKTVSQRSANISSQQKISEGIKQNGFGDGLGTIVGMQMAPELNPVKPIPNAHVSFDEQVEMLKKLKDLLDSGILTQEEFDTKKKEVMGL